MKKLRVIQQTTLTVADADTGEIQQQPHKYVAVYEKTLHPEPYFMAHHEGHALLAKMKLTGATHSVLHAALGRLDYSNRYTLLSTTEIAKDLNMQPTHVARALRTLCERGIFLKGPKFGNSNSYKLNDVYGWKGTSQDLVKQRRAQLKLVKPTAKEIRAD